VVPLQGEPTAWGDYVRPTGTFSGYTDEERLIQPTVFPAFASQLLDWQLNVNLAPEESGVEGRPDFTPADSVTHPFVFETKSTNKLVSLVGDEEQVKRYLTEGAPRIKAVLLTNLVGAKAYSLSPDGGLRLDYHVHLAGLLNGPEDQVALTSDAEHLADLIEQFSRRELSPADKIDRVRSAPPWNPLVEITSSDWILGRIDRIVTLITRDVLQQIHDGALTDQVSASGNDRRRATDELRLLASRLGETDASAPLSSFTSAGENTVQGKALQQFGAHVAYYAATRLMLVRVWEDLELLEPMLYDGGFNTQMQRFNDVLSDVVEYSFSRAKLRYRSLFDQHNGYTWYQPRADTYAEVIYELANTYLGAIQSDVLGQVYERLLERIDRKLLGAYYTPRDIIGLIWDLIGFDQVADEAEQQDRAPRVFDIATGSGGFLVEAAVRERQRIDRQLDLGATVDLQRWLNGAVDGLNGIELNRFSAYLAELNLLVQFGQVIARDPALKLPGMGVLAGDTLSLHDSDTLQADWATATLPVDLLDDDSDLQERARRIKFAVDADFLMDVACGNPPYIGEKTAAPLLAQTRRAYPYWDGFVGQHMDYLYWFLIAGVSKLRPGGRFGFITTEYWLRAEGARPLRRYLAARCHIDRIVLFRDFRLFPDAPGQHSMIVTGTRMMPPDQQHEQWPDMTDARPRVSIYLGGAVAGEPRARLLTNIRQGRQTSSLRSFNAHRSPNQFGEGSWGDVILTRAQLRQRDRLRQGAQVQLRLAEGVITTANNLTGKTEGLLTGHALQSVGGTGSRAGIQLLKRAEVDQLGVLNDAEQSVLRRQINTRDVFPYAVVLPEDAPSLVYLPKPEQVDASLSDEQVRAGTTFPGGLPALQQHLERFRGLLEAKARGWGERRPWWSVHRARADVLASDPQLDGDWAHYCVLSRWGAGGSMLVGLAPRDAVPASGLHILSARQQTVPATSLVALYNSTLLQEIAESLPPGQLRQADLERIGAPLLSDHVDALADTCNRQASLVTEIIGSSAPKFPLLADTFRSNPALTDTTSEIWLPAPWPQAHLGTLASVTWTTELTLHRAGGTLLGAVHEGTSLLGQQIDIMMRGSERVAASVFLEPHVSHDTTAALAAAIRGLAETGGRVRDLATFRVPIDPAQLQKRWVDDTTEVTQRFETYHRNRQLIDDVLAEAL
jgi:hypothetical protein